MTVAVPTSCSRLAPSLSLNVDTDASAGERGRTRVGARSAGQSEQDEKREEEHRSIANRRVVVPARLSFDGVGIAYVRGQQIDHLRIAGRGVRSGEQSA